MNPYLSSRKLPLLLLACGTFAGSVAHLKADSFNYSSLPGAVIQFSGSDTFTFSNSLSNPGDNFVVDNGAAVGLLGDISGTFKLGTITTVAGVSTAAVTGTGSITITDGSGDKLKATLTWIGVEQMGTLSVLNDDAAVDLTNITYAGTNPALDALAASGEAEDTLSFTFVPIKTLSTMATHKVSTSFSGTILAVPDRAAAICLFGLGLLGLAVMRRTRLARR